MGEGAEQIARVVGRLVEVCTHEAVPADVLPGAAGQLAPGKMLRTRMAARLAEALGSDRAAVERCCAAVEMVHTASLCHDDAGNPACERREQAGSEPARRVPKGCAAPRRRGAHNLTQRRRDRPRRLLWRSGCARAATATRSRACGPRPVWDYRNRLMQVKERQSGNWVTVADYKFDAMNRRVRRSVSNQGALNPACEQSEQTGREPAGRVPQGCNAEGGHNGVTRFLWGGGLSELPAGVPGDAGIAPYGERPDWQCLEERGTSDALLARYTYAPGYIDAVAVQERDLNSDADFADDDEVVYYHSNTLFSVYALSDSVSSVVERYRYDAYGGATVLDADGADDSDGWSDVKSPYLFTGPSVDRETGTGGPSTCLMYYRNRAYSTTLGRFISRDPLGYVDMLLCLYVYAASRPTAVRDPQGLLTEQDLQGLPPGVLMVLWQISMASAPFPWSEFLDEMVRPRNQPPPGCARTFNDCVWAGKRRYDATATMCQERFHTPFWVSNVLCGLFGAAGGGAFGHYVWPRLFITRAAAAAAPLGPGVWVGAAVGFAVGFSACIGIEYYYNSRGRQCYREALRDWTEDWRMCSMEKVVCDVRAHMRR